MIEREWREASDLRASRLALAVVLIAAAVLRFWALGRGIPYAVRVDEPEIVERAFNMMRTGSLNPHFFDYPGPLHLRPARRVGRPIPGRRDDRRVGSLAQASGGDFYLWGRAVTAAFGVATVLLVFQIGMRWGARHALLAAGLMAVMPLHVRYSHYVLTDTPLTFFVTLTLLLSLAAHERRTLRAFAWAGAAAGLAAATKYNGGLALLMPLLACWMTVAARPSRRLKRALAAVAALRRWRSSSPRRTPSSICRGSSISFARLAARVPRSRPPAEPVRHHLSQATSCGTRSAGRRCCWRPAAWDSGIVRARPRPGPRTRGRSRSCFRSCTSG